MGFIILSEDRKFKATFSSRRSRPRLRPLLARGAGGRPSTQRLHAAAVAVLRGDHASPNPTLLGPRPSATVAWPGAADAPSSYLDDIEERLIERQRARLPGERSRNQSGAARRARKTPQAAGGEHGTHRFVFPRVHTIFFLNSTHMYSIVGDTSCHLQYLEPVRGHAHDTSRRHLRTTRSEPHRSLSGDRRAPGNLSRLAPRRPRCQRLASVHRA
jgi:hypothetical protein